MKRTNQQNKALHKWCEMLADDLNDAGYSITKVLRSDVEIPWTKVTVKEILFKQIMKAMYKKHSTTELTTKELNKVSEVLVRHLAEKFGIDREFPSIDNIAQ